MRTPLGRRIGCWFVRCVNPPRRRARRTRVSNPDWAGFCQAGRRDKVRWTRARPGRPLASSRRTVRKSTEMPTCLSSTHSVNISKRSSSRWQAQSNQARGGLATRIPSGRSTTSSDRQHVRATERDARRDGRAVVTDEHFGNDGMKHVAELPESCCSRAGDDRFGVGQGRSGAACLERQRRACDQVDPVVQALEDAISSEVADRVASHAVFDQLCSGHHAMVRPSDRKQVGGAIGASGIPSSVTVEGRDVRCGAVPGAPPYPRPVAPTRTPVLVNSCSALRCNCSRERVGTGGVGTGAAGFGWGGCDFGRSADADAIDEWVGGAGWDRGVPERVETERDRRTYVAPTDRLITRPFVVVTLSALAFFMYIGTLLPLIPLFIEGPARWG